MGSAASHIAQMVSEVREKLPDLPAPPELDPEPARFRLFDGITTFLKNAGRGQPLVLVLDDLHWADKSSLLLLQFLAGELRDARLLVVGTYRDAELGRQHPLSQTIAELARGQLSRRILLPGLGERDVGRFIEITAGLKPPAALVAAVYRETEGNPFFVNEVVRLLVAEGRLERPRGARSWSIDIPEGVKAVVGRRLDRLSAECNRLLTIASVIGREFELAALERVSDLDEERLLELLEEAAAARIIAEVPQVLGRYAFSHALVRETLAKELPPTRRARLHRRIGEALETLYEGKVEGHLAELAHHFLEAARGGGDVVKATDYCARAGERATTSLAFEEAVEHCERALQALELRDPVDEQRRCELLLALGEARDRAGQPQDARESFLLAAGLARTLEAAELLARAALSFVGRGVGIVQVGKVDRELIGLTEEALAGLGEQDNALRSRLLGRLATELYFLPGSEARREELSRDAVEMARRLGDPTTLADALRARHIAVWGPENAEERLAITTEVVQLTGGGVERDIRVAARFWRKADLLELGDLATIDQEWPSFERDALATRTPFGQWVTLLHRTMRAIFDGRLGEVEALAQDALTAGQRVDPETATLAWAVQMVTLFYEVGRLTEIEQSLQVFAEQFPAIPGFRWSLPFVWVETGREDEARAEFERLAANDFADLPRDAFWLANMLPIVTACVSVGDSRRAAILYDLLLPFAERTLVHGFGVVSWGSTVRLLSRLATKLGRWEEAERHFETDLRWCEARGSRPHLTRGRQEYADMLLTRAGPGDREKALALLARALETAQEMGQKSVVEKALAAKLRAQGVEPREALGSIDAVLSSVQAARPNLQAHASGDGTLTIVFTDIEGSTSMVDRLGDDRAREVLGVHNRLVREQVRAHDGFEVQCLGDGFMLVFRSARRALRCAVAIQRAFADHSAPHLGAPLRVRIGLHAGETVRNADAFFGRAVYKAARVAAQAQGGEIVVSGLFRELTENAEEFRFHSRRQVELKGLSGPCEVYNVAW
jgi:class 3 adenylate cyclase